MSRPVPMSPRATAVGVLLTVVLTGAVLRSPIVAVAPVARQIEADFGVGAGIVGLLTSVPVLAFAICAPLAVALIRRGGIDLALTVALVGAVVGCVVRSFGGIPAALVGTALIGMFLTIGNVVVPLIIKREYPPERVAFMTGVFTSALNIGTMIATLSTAPIAAAADWRLGIAVWAAFALAALAAWFATRGVRVLAPVPAPRVADAERGAGRRASTWLLAIAFAGQAFAFYSTAAWLPTLLIDHGLDEAAAGAVASVFHVTAIAGALLLPVLSHRTSLALGGMVTGLAWLAIPLGFLLAPDAWLVWCALGGIAQGAGITWVFVMINALGGGERVVAGRSGTVQGAGYAVGAAGPIVLGALHEGSGAWTVPLLVLLAAILTFLVAGWRATRAR